MIVLASSSPRRKALLKQMGLDFKIVPSEIDEKLNPRLKPRHQAEVLSLQKAEAVLTKLPPAQAKDAVIIASDTLVALGGDIFGKPKNVADAKQMLKRLSGKTHSVFTGLTVISKAKRKTVTKSVETKITFKKLTPKEISAYCAMKEPYDKAGAYAMQGFAAVFIEKIEGDFWGAVGLPVNLLSEELKRVGIKVLG